MKQRNNTFFSPARTMMSTQSSTSNNDQYDNKFSVNGLKLKIKSTKQPKISNKTNNLSWKVFACFLEVIGSSAQDLMNYINDCTIVFMKMVIHFEKYDTEMIITLANYALKEFSNNIEDFCYLRQVGYLWRCCEHAFDRFNKEFFKLNKKCNYRLQYRMGFIFNLVVKKPAKIHIEKDKTICSIHYYSNGFRSTNRVTKKRCKIFLENNVLSPLLQNKVSLNAIYDRNSIRNFKIESNVTSFIQPMKIIGIKDKSPSPFGLSIIYDTDTNAIQCSETKTTFNSKFTFNSMNLIEYNLENNNTAPLSFKTGVVNTANIKNDYESNTNEKPNEEFDLFTDMKLCIHSCIIL